jgi:hypothetical protein
MVLLILAALAVPATAHAAFGASQMLTPSGPAELRSWSAAQFDDGSALVVEFDIDWRDDPVGALYVSTRVPGDAFRPPTQLSSSGDVQFDGSRGFDGPSGLASNAAGGAVITWVEDGRARVVLREPGGAFSPVQQLGPARGSIAWMDDRGDALVLAVAPDDSLYAFTGASGATRLGSRRKLGTVRGNVGELKDQFAAVQRKGGFVLAWQDCIPRPAVRRSWKCRHHVVRASVARGARLGKPQTLGPADAPALRPSLLAGPRGDVLALWSGRRAGAVRAARMAGTAMRFSLPRVISRSGHAAVSVTAAIGRHGGLAAWSEKESRALTRVVGAEIDEHGRIGPAFALAPRTEAGRLARVRVNDDGAALVLWHSPSRGRRGSSTPSWRLRSRASRGAFSRTVKLTDVENLEVALDGHGSVLALLRPKRSGQDPDACFPGTSELRGAVWKAGSQPTFQRLDDCVWFNGLSLAVNASGQALAAWHRIPAPSEQQGGGVRLSVRSPDAGFGAPSTVAGPDGSWPEVTLTDNNRALILWGAEALKAALDDALAG